MEGEEITKTILRRTNDEAERRYREYNVDGHVFYRQEEAMAFIDGAKFVLDFIKQNIYAIPDEHEE
jgi:hypothetical protein